MPDPINTVRTKHQSRLMATPGVVLVGIGRNNHGQSVIVVGVESLDELAKITLPEELDGYPVRVQIMETIRDQ
jgi:hypothetical protein